LALVSGAALAGSVRAAPPDDLPTPDEVTAPDAIAKIRGNKKKGKRVPNAATLRNFDKNPHLKPQGNKFSAAEQAQYTPQSASGRGL
jgi:hypothetical protein